MLHITICDDEPVQLSLMEAFVKEWAKTTGTETVLDFCRNADQFLFLWEEKKDIDILLLDIEMPGMNGVSLAHFLRGRGEKLQIIFVTGIADYVLEGYEVDAVSYLLKPVRKERMYACLGKAKERCGRKEPELVLETAGEAIKVKVADICYLESAAHDTIVHCVSLAEALRCKTGIRQMEQLLQSQSAAFYKIHRSYLINLAHVARITRKEVQMETKELLPIARGKWEGLNQAYLTYYRRKLEKE